MMVTRILQGKVVVDVDTAEVKARIVDGTVEHWEPKPRPTTKPVARRPCSGCGGAKYDVRAHLQPGAMDEVIQRMD